MKYTCTKDGAIHFKVGGGIMLKNWHFKLVDISNNIGSKLSPYISVNSNNPEAILNIKVAIPT